MRVSKTFSIDEAVLANLRAIELETGMKINDLVNDALMKYTIEYSQELELNEDEEQDDEDEDED